jgi:hypothetical protein
MYWMPHVPGLLRTLLAAIGDYAAHHPTLYIHLPFDAHAHCYLLLPAQVVPCSRALLGGTLQQAMESEYPQYEQASSALVVDC